MFELMHTISCLPLCIVGFRITILVYIVWVKLSRFITHIIYQTGTSLEIHVQIISVSEGKLELIDKKWKKQCVPHPGCSFTFVHCYFMFFVVCHSLYLVVIPGLCSFFLNISIQVPLISTKNFSWGAKHQYDSNIIV